MRPHQLSTIGPERLGSRGIVFALLLASTGAAAAQEPSPPSIVTSGEAVVRRAPERAFVTVAVEARAKSPRDASRQAADTMTSVRQRIGSAGIPPDALRTASYDLQQEADFVDGKRVARGYVARNAIEIRIDAVDRVGETLDMVVQGGATSVSGIRFDLKDRASAEREAVRLAVADARGRAEAAAAGAGKSLDRILRIEEVREPEPPVRPVMTMARVAELQTPTPIEPGTIEIRARVVLTSSFR